MDVLIDNSFVFLASLGVEFRLKIKDMIQQTNRQSVIRDQRDTLKQMKSCVSTLLAVGCGAVLVVVTHD